MTSAFEKRMQELWGSEPEKFKSWKFRTDKGSGPKEFVVKYDGKVIGEFKWNGNAYDMTVGGKSAGSAKDHYKARDSVISKWKSSNTEPTSSKPKNDEED